MADIENSTTITIAVEEVGKEKKTSPVKRSSEAGGDSPAKKIMKTEEEVNGKGDAASVEAEAPKTEKMNGNEEVAVEAGNDANGNSEEADAAGEKDEKENLAKDAPDGVETEKLVASTDAEAKSEAELAEGKKTGEDNGKQMEADAAVTKEETS